MGHIPLGWVLRGMHGIDMVHSNTGWQSAECPLYSVPVLSADAPPVPSQQQSMPQHASACAVTPSRGACFTLLPAGSHWNTSSTDVFVLTYVLAFTTSAAFLLTFLALILYRRAVENRECG
jgi:hypothetical protein